MPANDKALSTRELVFLAADSLMREGVRPTAAAVREKVGRGSQSTITSALKDWWEDHVQRNQRRAPEGIPQSVYDLVGQAWDQISQHAQAEALVQARKEFEQQRAELEKHRDAAQAEARAANEKTIQLERERDVALAQLEAERTERAAVRESLAEAGAKNETLKSAVAEMRLEVERLKGVVGEKERLISEQQGTLAQWGTKASHLENQVTHLRETQAESERLLASERGILLTVRAQLDQVRSDARDMAAAYKKDLELAQSARNELETRLSAKTAERDLFEKELVRLRSDFGDQAKKVDELTMSLGQARVEIAEAHTQAKHDSERIQSLEKRVRDEKKGERK